MPGNEIERRFVPAEMRMETRDDGTRKLTGYAAVFESMSDDLGWFQEKIARNAFDGRMGDDVRCLFNHDSNLILGRNKAGTLRLSADDRGLLYEVDMPDTTYARDLAVSIERGDVSQNSFAFRVAKEEWDETTDPPTRTILQVERLFDVSPVTYPAYPDTSLALRSFEEAKAERDGEHDDDDQVDKRAGGAAHTIDIRLKELELIEQE